MNLRADCKVGGWFLCGANYGARLQFIALKFTRRIAGEGLGFIPPGTPLGELWFLPVGGGIGTDDNGREIKLPMNYVYCTLLKNSRKANTKRDTGIGSLANFGQKAMLLAAEGFDYREVVWCPIFRKKEGNANGAPLSYYVLDWAYALPDDQDEHTFGKVGECIKMIESESTVSRMYDQEIEANSIAIDGMSREEMQLLLTSLQQSKPAIAPAN